MSRPRCACGAEAIGTDWTGPVCFDCAEEDLQALV